MATAKGKGSYITLELEYMEQKIQLLKEAVDRMLEDPQDRYGPKELPNGKVVDALIKDRESQVKDATSILEKIPKMLQALDELRQREEAKLETRKGQGLNGLMEFDLKQ